MEAIYEYEPDVICLPETFQTSWVNERKKREEYAEDEDKPGPVTSILAEVAKKQNCYIVCPIVTKKEEHFYNSAILLDRKGKIVGTFNKVHPVSTERGITAGPLKPPVFKRL